MRFDLRPILVVFSLIGFVVGAACAGIYAGVRLNDVKDERDQVLKAFNKFRSSAENDCKLRMDYQRRHDAAAAYDELRACHDNLQKAKVVLPGSCTNGEKICFTNDDAAAILDMLERGDRCSETLFEVKAMAHRMSEGVRHNHSVP